MIGDPNEPICSSGKRGFPDRAAAEENLRKVRAARAEGHAGRRADAAESAVYECPACHWWHLSSTTKATRREHLGNTKTGRRRRR